MSKKKYGKARRGSYPAVCGTCMEPIDLMRLTLEVRMQQYPVKHECGRILVKGK